MAGNSGSRGENVAEMFRSLQALVGDWHIDQRVFRGPNTQPIKNTGRVTCRSLIGELAVIVITEIPTSGLRIAQLMTYNPRTTRYELSIVDASLDQGLVLLTGEELNERSSPEIRDRFGKAAMAVRQWDITDAGTVLGGLVGEAPTGEPRALRVIENQISADRWVVEFLLRGPQGEFVVLENVITRAQPGCQPQLGCELGCAGLPGCQQGCEGLQGQIGTQGLLGCQCPSQRTGTSMMARRS